MKSHKINRNNADMKKHNPSRRRRVQKVYGVTLIFPNPVELLFFDTHVSIDSATRRQSMPLRRFSVTMLRISWGAVFSNALHEELTGDPTAIRNLCIYAQAKTAPNGGREWINTVDGVKQYPDMRELKDMPRYIAVNYAPVEPN